MFCCVTLLVQLDKKCYTGKVKINFQKIILSLVKLGIEPFAVPHYPGTWMLRQIVKELDKALEEELEKKPTRQQKYYIGQIYKKLLAEKAITFGKDGYLCLTSKGEKSLANYRLDQFEIKKPKKWDGKFRVITFDISEQKNKIRIALRRQLSSRGFVLLQYSVWVYPYECQELVALLKAHFGIVTEVIYITAENIENDHWLRKQFKLPLP